MNRIDKPKKTSAELVQMLEDKGVSFKYTSKYKAEAYLSNINNYLRTAAYRKNYQKYLNGRNKDKYIDLDFAHLQELSTIDMHLRSIILKMCIDIEHDLKVKLLSEIENNNAEDGYSIVDKFLSANQRIVQKIEVASSSPYTGNLIEKNFIITKTISNGRVHNKITGYDCSVWALMEMLTFGDFIRFYEFYYSIYKNKPVSTTKLNIVKSLRNAAAHNNCIIYDLSAGSSKCPPEISNAIKNISSITSTQRRKKLSCRAILEFTTMLLVYDEVVSSKIKKHRIAELKDLFNVRMKNKAGFFKKNELILSSYDFTSKVIQNIFSH